MPGFIAGRRVYEFAAAEPYINSTEGARTSGVANRPAAGQRFKFAASLANGLNSNIAVGDLFAPAVIERPAVDFKTRKHMKLGAAAAPAGGVWHFARLALYAAPLTEAQARKLATL